jgi:hypothetical protein
MLRTAQPTVRVTMQTAVVMNERKMSTVFEKDMDFRFSQSML